MRPPVELLPPAPRLAGPADAASARRAEHGTFKKLMVATMLLATVGTLASGTLATFNAQTVNAGDSITTGTLVLLDEVNASIATDCYSTGVSAGTFTNGNSNSGCASNNFTPTSVKPGAAPTTMKVKVRNAGSLPAATLSLLTASCAASDNPAESFHYPGGDPCGQVQLYVQEWTDGTYATPLGCAYGTVAAGATCGFQSGSPTLSTFTGAHNSPATALPLTGGLAAGAARYFTIALQLPLAATNQVQGRQATFDLTWYLEQ